MSTDPRDARATMIAAVQASAELAAWCVERFGRRVTIVNGLNQVAPPAMKGQCPMVIFGTATRMREANHAHRQAGIYVGCAIECDKQKQERVGEEVVTVTHLGVDLLDEFACRVEAICTKALNENGYASQQEPAVEDETLPPFFKACWAYMIRCPSRLT